MPVSIWFTWTSEDERTQVLQYFHNGMLKVNPMHAWHLHSSLQQVPTKGSCKQALNGSILSAHQEQIASMQTGDPSIPSMDPCKQCHALWTRTSSEDLDSRPQNKLSAQVLHIMIITCTTPGCSGHMLISRWSKKPWPNISKWMLAVCL